MKKLLKLCVLGLMIISINACKNEPTLDVNNFEQSLMLMKNSLVTESDKRELDMSIGIISGYKVQNITIGSLLNPAKAFTSALKDIDGYTVQEINEYALKLLK